MHDSSFYIHIISTNFKNSIFMIKRKLLIVLKFNLTMQHKQATLEKTLEELEQYEIKSDLWTRVWKFPSEQRFEVAILEKIISEALKKAGFGRDEIQRAILVSEEALTNAIKHGNKRNIRKYITFGFYLFPPENACIAEFFCEDEGNGFNPERVPNPTEENNLTKDHGRGIFLMKNYADGLAYNRKGNRIEWYILHNQNK